MNLNVYTLFAFTFAVSSSMRSMPIILLLIFSFVEKTTPSHQPSLGKKLPLQINVHMSVCLYFRSPYFKLTDRNYNWHFLCAHIDNGPSPCAWYEKRAQAFKNSLNQDLQKCRPRKRRAASGQISRIYTNVQLVQGVPIFLQKTFNKSL